MQKVLRLNAAPPKRLVHQRIWDSRKQAKENHPAITSESFEALMQASGCFRYPMIFLNTPISKELLYLRDQECLEDIHCLLSIN